MRDPKPSPASHRRCWLRHATIVAVGAAFATLSIAAGAEATTATHRVKLDSAMFAAQVGSTTHGGSVYAGAVPDPKLGHGAIVFSTSGRTRLHVSFQEFFALGSLTGSGNVTLVPGSSGQATFTGSLTISGGTAGYQNARGKLRTAGTLDDSGMVQATLKGSFTT